MRVIRCSRRVIRSTCCVVAVILFSHHFAQAGELDLSRIVFIGDSITDGHTCPLLVRQAFVDAKLPVPVCINAGIAGDTAQGMQGRIERDVLAHRPTLVTLSVGINDVMRKVKLAEYEADVRSIVRQVREKKIPLVILTTSIVGAKHTEPEERLKGYNAILRQVAQDNDCPVAEVNALMDAARNDKTPLLEADDIHLSFAGYRVMARAILDALGHKAIPVPEKLPLEPLPGLIRQWKVRVAPADQYPLDEKTALRLLAADGWKELALPETKPRQHWWEDQERQRGFAQSLAELVAPGKNYQALVEISAEKARPVYFNTGAQLESIWLNGKRIYRSQGWTGWHAGKERVAATLEPGKNLVIIESGGAFFLSVTDDNSW